MKQCSYLISVYTPTFSRDSPVYSSSFGYCGSFGLRAAYSIKPKLYVGLQFSRLTAEDKDAPNSNKRQSFISNQYAVLARYYPFQKIKFPIYVMGAYGIGGYHNNITEVSGFLQSWQTSAGVHLFRGKRFDLDIYYTNYYQISGKELNAKNTWGLSLNILL